MTARAATGPFRPPAPAGAADRASGPQTQGDAAPVGASKVWSADRLEDRWEHVRRDLDDVDDGTLSIFTPEDRIDGFLLGGDRKLYPPDASLRTLPPVVAEQRAPGSIPPARRVDVIHVNGIMTPAVGQYDDMQALANTLSDNDGPQAEVRGIHNGTNGFVPDVIQAAGDKLGIGHNRAVTTLKNKILDRTLAGEPANLVFHSHGAIIGSRALREAKLTLQMEHGMTKAEAEDLLHRTTRVVTTGGASWRFPDGPEYLHFINTKDLVAVGVGLGSAPEVPSASGFGPIYKKAGQVLAGVGSFFVALRGDPGAVWRPGRDSEIVAFEKDDGLGRRLTANHQFEGTYLEFMTDRRAQIMGTVDQDGFFLRGHHRTAAPQASLTPHGTPRLASVRPPLGAKESRPPG